MNDLAPAQALQDLIRGISTDLDTCTPDKAPYRIRSRLITAITRSDVLLESSELLLRQMRFAPSERFLFRDRQSRFTLQLFCWAPKFGNLPHLHTNWTVSAVLAGSISVRKSSISKEDCQASVPLLASAGEVGVLKPPQYHCLANHSSSESAVTFHVFPVDQAYHQETAELDQPVKRIDSVGIVTLAKLAVRYKGRGHMDILRHAFEVAGDHTKLELIKLLAQVDRREAVRLGTVLADQVGGADGDRLKGVLLRLEGDAGGGVRTKVGP